MNINHHFAPLLLNFTPYKTGTKFFAMKFIIFLLFLFFTQHVKSQSCWFTHPSQIQLGIGTVKDKMNWDDAKSKFGYDFSLSFIYNKKYRRLFYSNTIGIQKKLHSVPGTKVSYSYNVFYINPQLNCIIVKRKCSWTISAGILFRLPILRKGIAAETQMGDLYLDDISIYEGNVIKFPFASQLFYRINERCAIGSVLRFVYDDNYNDGGVRISRYIHYVHLPSTNYSITFNLGFIYNFNR